MVHLVWYFWPETLLLNARNVVIWKSSMNMFLCVGIDVTVTNVFRLAIGGDLIWLSAPASYSAGIKFDQVHYVPWPRVGRAWHLVVLKLAGKNNRQLTCKYPPESNTVWYFFDTCEQSCRWDYWDCCTAQTAFEWRQLCVQRYSCQCRTETIFKRLSQMGMRRFLLDDDDVQPFCELTGEDFPQWCSYDDKAAANPICSRDVLICTLKDILRQDMWWASAIGM